MLYVITGQPGNGKSLMAMHLMEEEYERNKKANALPADHKDHEPLRRFFSNIAGATTQENPNAFPWVEPMPEHRDWTQLPDFSYVQYDEAHSDGQTPGLERYGLLFPSTGKPGESHDPRIRAMSTHRHRGFDLVLMTQFPTKIHHQVRTLVGKHVHMNRAMGMQRAGVLTWTRMQSDPYDEKQREKAEEEIWGYPKDKYGRYFSAKLHTSSHKFRLPAKFWGGLSMLVTAALVFWLLWLFVFKPATASDESPVEATGAAQAGAPSGAGALPASAEPSPDDYLDRLRPRDFRMPWSAPIFDGRSASAEPRLFCMSSQEGHDANGRHRLPSCSCLTEQGTRVRDIPIHQCIELSVSGEVYNPYRRQEPPQRSHDAYQATHPLPPQPEQHRALLSGVQTPNASVASYGDFGYETGRYIGRSVTQ